MSAKINNTPIKIKSLVPRVSKKLSVQRPPGQNSDAIEGLGSQGAELQISLQADTLAEKHSWAAEFLKTGPQVLTDPDGFIYNIVESQASGGRDYTGEPNLDQRWLFGFSCLMEEPFKFSSTEIPRLKTITTNGQEWSADDSANSITTAGTIDVIPDIEVVAGALGSDFEREGKVLQVIDTTTNTTTATTYTLVKTITLSAVSGKAHRIDTVLADLRVHFSAYKAQIKITIQATSLYGGVETTVYESVPSSSDAFITYTAVVGITAGNDEDVVIRYYTKTIGNVSETSSKNYTINYTEMMQAVTKDLTIYNTADTTRKTRVCNEIPPGTTVKINKNGTGVFNYIDTFIADTYKYVSYDYNNVTYDSVDEDITFAATDGYLIYKIDCKYPITSIPDLLLYIISGTIKTAIAKNINGVPGTYYDIDEQFGGRNPLNNAQNCVLKGETSFFVKIYTDGTECVIYTLILAINVVTIDTLLPKIYLGGPNTFRADQNSDSSLNATVTLTYRDGDWAI